MKITLFALVLLLAPTSVLAQVDQMSQTPPPNDPRSARPWNAMPVDPMTTGVVRPVEPLVQAGSNEVDAYSARNGFGDRSPKAWRRPRS